MILKYGDAGTAVKKLQGLLNGNTYRHVRRRLDVDGEFGPLTAAAVAGTKFWMGYPKGELSPQAGDKFMELVSGRRPLPPEYAERRHKRLARITEHADQTLLRTKALVHARDDVGLLEGPNNGVKYNDWWCAPNRNDGGAYCVRAGSFWYNKAGSLAVVRGSRWQNTDAMLNDAMNGDKGIHLTSEPQPGDGFVIDWEGHSNPDHFGLFVKDVGGGKFQSLEANATLDNGRQGVGYHERRYAQCWFIEFEE